MTLVRQTVRLWRPNPTTDVEIFAIDGKVLLALTK
jgi:hypothetical protein